MLFKTAPVNQAEVLTSAFIEEGLSHGTEARVDISNVRIGVPQMVPGASEREPFFCHIQGVRVRRVIKKGDGGAIAPELTLVGFDFPDTDGYVDLKNLRYVSNGREELIFVLGESRMVPASSNS